MRCGILVAAALTMASATGAHAQEWCGYSGRVNALIECGYTSLEGCENTIGKGAMCFVNPFVVMNTRRATPLIAAKRATPKG